MFNTHTALIILVAAIVTATLRFAPFIVWNGKRKTPEYIVWLGNVLPYAIMAMLVVYTLRNTDFAAVAGWLPAIAGVAVTGGVQAWKHNSVYSILAGTICYMVLIQII